MQKISRRLFFTGAVATAVAAQLKPIWAMAATRPLLFVGTATRKGIFAYQWDAEKGEMLSGSVAVETPFPTFLVWSPDKHKLYSVNSIKGTADTISSFSRQGSSLHTLNSVSSGGVNPCHIAIDHSGKVVFAANYNSGTFSSFHVDETGKLNGPISRIVQQGHGPVAERQEGPHAHRATVSPDNRFVYVNDLGRDSIDIYTFSTATGEVTNVGKWTGKPGSGPRSLRFHPNGKIAYCVNELDSSVEVLNWNKKTGNFESIQRVDLLPADYKGPTRGCESVLTRKGDFAYFANRDYDFMASYKCDPITGKLTFLKRSTCGGKLPRHIALDPSERWLLVANQNSNSIAILSRDAKSGELSETAKTVELEAPMCLLFD